MLLPCPSDQGLLRALQLHEGTRVLPCHGIAVNLMWYSCNIYLQALATRGSLPLCADAPSPSHYTGALQEGSILRKDGSTIWLETRVRLPVEAVERSSTLCELPEAGVNFGSKSDGVAPVSFDHQHIMHWASRRSASEQTCHSRPAHFDRSSAHWRCLIDDMQVCPALWHADKQGAHIWCICIP